MTSLTFLAQLPNLEELDLCENSAVEWDSLPWLERLCKLTAYGANVTSLAFLAQLPNIEELNVRDNSAVDWGTLPRLKHLHKLDPQPPNMTSLALLTQLPNLETLQVWEQTLQIKTLRELDIPKTITSLIGFDLLPVLEELRVGGGI